MFHTIFKGSTIRTGRAQCIGNNKTPTAYLILVGVEPSPAMLSSHMAQWRKSMSLYIVGSPEKRKLTSENKNDD